MAQVVKRGDIYYADLSPVIGSEQGGVRPVLIIQNDIGNKYSPTVIITAITSQINKAKLPTHVEISSEEYGLNKDSVILLEQIRTIDKRRLKDRIGHINDELMVQVDQALMISLGMIEV
jgi:mRNA interferase MazF